MKGQFLIDTIKCSQCGMTVNTYLQKQASIVFLCGHAFHQNCLPKDKDPFCHLCSKKTLDLQSKLESKKAAAAKEAATKEEFDQMQRTKLMASELMSQNELNDKQEGVLSAFESLQQKRMEFFDQSLNGLGLLKASFS